MYLANASVLAVPVVKLVIIIDTQFSLQSELTKYGRVKTLINIDLISSPL